MPSHSGRAPAVIAVVSLLAATACSSGGGGAAAYAETTAATPVTAVSTSTTPPVEPESPIALPRRDVEFRVQLPEGTEAASVLIMPLADWAVDQHVALLPDADGAWSATVSLEDRALVRYAYDRWDEQVWGEEFKEAREFYEPRLRIENRLLLVDGDPVEDVVAGWKDGPWDRARGSVSGIVVDADSGSPLADTDITAGGYHTATDHRGRFTIAGLPPGLQRITAFRALGDHLPGSITVEVGGGASSTVELALAAAEPVTVTFDVALPADMPPDDVKLAANVARGGARDGVIPRQPTPELFPVLDRDGNRATVSLDLYAGTYVQYFYTLAGSLTGQEVNADGDWEYRSFVVDTARALRRDRVASFRPPADVAVTLRVSVPPGIDVPIYGGGFPMSRLDADTYVQTLYRLPGEQLEYRYLPAGMEPPADGEADWAGSRMRSLTVPAYDVVVDDVVQRWPWQPDTAAATEPFEVTVRVSVPAATPTEPPLRLGGDIPELADGVMMVPDRLDPTLWSATVTVDTPTQARIWFDRGSDSTTSTDRHQVELTYPGQTVDLWVSAWQDMDGGIEPRPGFITGIYTPDWTAPQTFATVPATYRRIGAHNGGWVVVSSVAQYGQTQPLPQVELRPMRVAAAALPSYDIERHAALAGDAGLSVILGTQINMEMSPGGLDAVCSPQADGWWQAWLDEAEEVRMLHAAAAADAGIEAMVLPGHCFHVFPWEGHMGNPEVEAAFDQRVAAMIDEVRQVYPGRLIVSGSAPQFDFPALADLVGVTTYDTGHRDLPYNATVEEWTAAYDTLFADTVDPRWERWHRPVLFYTVHVPPHPDDQDPASGAVQARQLEAIFRAIEARPWVTGVLSWSYDWVDYPLASSDGVRARLAEAVLAKHYAMLGG